MKPLCLDEVCKALGARRAGGQVAPPPLTGVSTDTRTCRPGDLYFAIKGERFDGHDFLPRAAAGGCAAAVVARDAGLPDGAAGAFPGGLLAVENTVKALGALGSYYRAMLGATVIAVTGSNGKTTTKRLIQHILSKRLKGTAGPKSFNNNIGVPLTLVGAGAADDYVVCEVGTNAPGEIAELGAICRPDIAAIVSVSETHLERLGSIERVAVEKASLLGFLREGGAAVVHGDSEVLAKALRAHRCKVIRFGASPDADLRLTACEPMGDRQRFCLNGRTWCDLPLAGRHNALNALAAIAVAQRMGFSQEHAAAALADFPGSQMRLEWLTIGDLRVINDAYNANPASMAAAAEVLSQTPGARRVLVAGDMRELGDRARELHLGVGRQVSRCGIDLVVAVGDLGRYIAQGAAEGGVATESFDSVESAAPRIASLLRGGDVVLLKGSRAMAMERLLGPLRAAHGCLREAEAANT